MPFIWITVPPFPVVLTYRLLPPGTDTGAKPVTGSALWSTDGGQLTTDPVETIFSQSAKDQHVVGGASLLHGIAAPKVLAGSCAEAGWRLESDHILTGRTLQFETVLRNRSASSPMSGISLDVSMLTAAGAAAGANFTITPVLVEGVGDIDGTGSLAAGGFARVVWALTPLNGAATGAGTDYLLVGSAGFTQEGDSVVLELADTPLSVLPLPEAEESVYFPASVFGDDPASDTVEVSESFGAGVLLRNASTNTLSGTVARDAVPLVLDLDDALPVPLVLEDTRQGNQANVPNRFRANLGTLAGGASASASWLLSPATVGVMDDFPVRYLYRGPENSRNILVPATSEALDLVRLVRLDQPADDGIPDYLVNAFPDPGRVPDNIHASDGQIFPLTVAFDIEVEFVSKNTERIFSATANRASGWNYVIMGDPTGGLYDLIEVRRSDESVVRAENVWTTRRSVRDESNAPVLESRIQWLDFSGAADSETYQLIFERNADQNTAPIARRHRHHPDKRQSGISRWDHQRRCRCGQPDLRLEHRHPSRRQYRRVAEPGLAHANLGCGSHGRLCDPVDRERWPGRQSAGHRSGDHSESRPRRQCGRGPDHPPGECRHLEWRGEQRSRWGRPDLFVDLPRPAHGQRGELQQPRQRNPLFYPGPHRPLRSPAGRQ
ncbi:MAG: hypothetical protein HC888_08695 [Candidatus Competibacteraceae bacterium]|nr:hypothetical protein [Candidatus Competibacteraceae bacterium]